MILFLVLTDMILALQYNKNEAFQLNYQSKISNFIEGANTEGQQTWDISCIAHFEVKIQQSTDSLIAMSLYDVKIKADNIKEQTDAQLTNAEQEAYNHPVYFFYRTDGTVFNITENAKDPAYINSFKHGIINSLQTRIGEPNTKPQHFVVSDSQGTHNEHFQIDRIGKQLRITSQYSESDFISFSNEKVSQTMLQLNVNNTRIVEDDRIIRSEITMRIDHNSIIERNVDSPDAHIVTIAQSVLDNIKIVTSNNNDFPFKSLDDLLSADPNIQYTPSHKQETTLQHSDLSTLHTPSNSDGQAECPGDIELCHVYSHTIPIVIGKIARSEINISSVIGITPGCNLSNESRSYIVGAYSQIDAHLLRYEFPKAVEFYAEYGQLYGEPLRNGAQLKFQQKPVWNYVFPELDCKLHKKKEAKKTSTLKIEYDLPVLVLVLHFEAGINTSVGYSIEWSICQQNLNSNLQIIPDVQLVLFGSASSSIGILKAGIELTGGTKSSIDSLAEINTDKCLAHTSAFFEIDPLSVKLEAYWETKKKRKAVDIIDIEEPQKSIKIFDIEFKG